MDVGLLLAWLLGIAVLSPLLSFALILLCGPWMGRYGRLAGRCATGAIVLSCGLSLVSLGIWVYHHPPHDVAPRRTPARSTTRTLDWTRPLRLPATTRPCRSRPHPITARFTRSERLGAVRCRSACTSMP